MAATDKALGALVDSNEFLEVVAVGGGDGEDTTRRKVRCSLTGHEMPLKEEAVKKYLDGKAYKKAAKREASRRSWAEETGGDDAFFGPYIIESIKDKEHSVFCTLTHLVMDRNPAVVRKHMQSRKFRRLSKEADEKAERKRAKEERRAARRAAAIAAGEDPAAAEDDSEDSDSDSDDSDRKSEEGKLSTLTGDKEVAEWTKAALLEEAAAEEAAGTGAGGAGKAGAGTGKRTKRKPKARQSNKHGKRARKGD